MVAAAATLSAAREPEARGARPGALLVAGTVLAGGLLALGLKAWAAQTAAAHESAGKGASGDCREASGEAPQAEEKGAPDVVDIEDLVGKSLIPQVLQQMKEDGVTPYSMEEKRQRMDELEGMKSVPNFMATLRKHKLGLKRTQTEVMQLNIGFYCNQACTHCHVDSSPKRKEMMSRAVADKCLDIIRKSPSVQIVDLTGGAPELNRQFKHLVTGCRAMGKEVIDRCNLTVLLEPHQEGLPAFLAEHKVHIIASLPCYLEQNVNSQRGDQIFERSIKALQMLNEHGYGMPGTGLELDLVYNPTGVHLPPARGKLEGDYKAHLMKHFGIAFNQLHCITNMPINRFYDHLKAHGDLEKYMHILVDNFNPDACGEVMCRSYLSVDPSGTVFDCDFNQQLGLGLKFESKGADLTVFDFETTDELQEVRIVTKKHCFGCTAGAGSS